jgi:hypothetical protein
MTAASVEFFSSLEGSSCAAAKAADKSLAAQRLKIDAYQFGLVFLVSAGP